jgi:hypothetical protein
MKFEVRQNVIELIKLKVMIALGLMIFCSSFAFGQTPSKSLNLKPIRDIKNFDFKTIYNAKTSPYFLRASYGDVTGDQKEEAVILLRTSDTGRNLDEVFIYSLIHKKVVNISRFAAGQRGEYVLSIKSLGSNFKVENRILVLDLAVLREGECVPANYYTIKYRWNGIQMEEIERSALKPLPEYMREIG